VLEFEVSAPAELLTSAPALALSVSAAEATTTATDITINAARAIEIIFFNIKSPPNVKP
jgi:hypothetical protein